MARIATTSPTETYPRIATRAVPSTGRSGIGPIIWMEEEARNILRTALATEDDQPTDRYRVIRRNIDRFGGVDLPLPDRDPLREPPALTP